MSFTAVASVIRKNTGQNLFVLHGPANPPQYKRYAGTVHFGVGG